MPTTVRRRDPRPQRPQGGTSAYPLGRTRILPGGDSAAAFGRYRQRIVSVRGTRLFVDALIAVVVLTFSLAAIARGGFDDDGESLDAVAVVLVALTALPLVGRRVAPLPVFAVVTAATATLYGLRYGLGPPLGFAVALYTVADERPEGGSAAESRSRGKRRRSPGPPPGAGWLRARALPRRGRVGGGLVRRRPGAAAARADRRARGARPERRARGRARAPARRRRGAHADRPRPARLRGARDQRHPRPGGCGPPAAGTRSGGSPGRAPDRRGGRARHARRDRPARGRAARRRCTGRGRASAWSCCVGRPRGALSRLRASP